MVLFPCDMLCACALLRRRCVVLLSNKLYIILYYVILYVINRRYRCRRPALRDDFGNTVFKFLFFFLRNMCLVNF